MRSILGFSLVAILVTSCTPAGLSAEQVHATAQIIAAQTLGAAHTEIPTSTSQPSATLQPFVTESPTASDTPTETLTPTFQFTATAFGQLSTSDFATAKANKSDKNAPLVLDNRSGKTIRFVITSPVYQEYVFTESMTIIIPEAVYTFQAWIGEKGVNGSFEITNGDKHVLSFYADKWGFKTP